MKPLLLLLCAAVLSSCTGTPWGTIYSSAVDKRTVGEQLSDTKMKAKIEKRFIDDPDVKVLDISAYVYLHNVYLVGEYRSDAEKEKIVSIVKAMENVKAVTPFMFPKAAKDDPCGAGTRLKMKAKVSAKLIGDNKVHSTNVDVDTVQCHVVLLGYVGTQEEIDRAIARAKSVDGVKSVKSFLKVLNE